MSGVYRPSLIASYVNSIKLFLTTNFPHFKEDEIEEFIKKKVSELIQRPKAQIVSYPRYGDQELIEVDLLNLIRKYNNKTISPFGTFYETTDVHVPNNKEFLDTLVANRDKAKKAMFKYIEQNKPLEASIKEAEQALNKIAANSVSGGHGTALNALYDLETYSSITSLCRHGTMIAYTFTERFLAGNYYFPEFEDALNFIITTAEMAPPDKEVENVLDKYQLNRVWGEELYELMLSGMDKYIVITEAQKRLLIETCEKLSAAKRSFVYYSRSLYNLFNKNKEVMTKLFTEIFTLDKNNDCLNRTDVTTDYIKEIDGDLEQAAQTIYGDLLGPYIIRDVAKESPELGLTVAKVLKSFQDILDYWDPVIDMFFHSKTMVAKAHINKNMLRKVIIVSDTDSIIFTSKDMVTLYLGGTFSYDKPFVYGAHALCTYFLCKSVASLLRMIAIQRGAVGEKNIKMLKMKNEFFYPVFVRTNQSKHYIGQLTVREGVILPKPKLDIKGVGFKSSNVPKITHEFTDKLIKILMKDVTEHTNIYAGDYISEVLRYEKFIYDSIKKGEFTYFTNISIKKKEEYKNPEVSIYANYLIWQNVFAEKYGDIYVPTKCVLIPFVKGKYKHPSYLQWLEMKSPAIYEKYIKMLEKNGKKPLTRLPIPVSCPSIPEEIIPLIDMRSIIYKNMSPAQLLLKSITVDLGNSKRQPLFSDYYSCVFDKDDSDE